MSDDIQYIPPAYIPKIFKAIEKYLQTNTDPVPTYSTEKEGFKKLVSSLEMIQNSYYPDFYSKASYLFLTINKGHFFSNGNKRLSAVFLKLFYSLNGYTIDEDYNTDSTKTYQVNSQSITIDLSGDEIEKEFFQNDYQLIFLYNLALKVARNDFGEIGFDELKTLTRSILQNTLRKYE